MTPTDPSSREGQARRPSGGGGATYRHPSDDMTYPTGYHDGVDGHAPDDDLHNPEVAHEHSDVNVRGIIMSGVILAVVGIVSQFVIVLLFGYFERDAAANQPAVSPVARPATEMPRATREVPTFTPTGTAAGPQLLTNEPMALEAQRAEEDKRLNYGGWLNQTAGLAHIPIEHAKKLIVERGLPVRADSVVAPGLGTRVPAAGESSGGRVITVPLPEPQGAAPAGQKGH